MRYSPCNELRQLVGGGVIIQNLFKRSKLLVTWEQKMDRLTVLQFLKEGHNSTDMCQGRRNVEIHISSKVLSFFAGTVPNKMAAAQEF